MMFLVFNFSSIYKKTVDFNDFYVFTNTTKVSHDTRAISMFSGSKPDLMMFRKNNPGTGVVCQYKEEEDMETEETEQKEYIAQIK